MRLRSAVTLLLITFVAAPPVTVNGQEDPLPAVTPKVASFAIPAELPMVFLAVEPIRDFRQPSLLEAARANDYVTFDALYRDAKARGEATGAYDTLYELWTYAVTDPIGAFYGRDLYERLARAYPGYARFIDDYRIVDDRGAVFYPTSETRAFLLDRIVEGDTPRVLVAEQTSRDAGRTAGRTADRTTRTDTTDTAAASPSTRERRSSGSRATAGTAARRQNAGGAARRETGGPVTTAAGTTARATAAPVTTASAPVTAPATVRPVASTPAPAPVPVSDAPPVVAETPAVVATTPAQPAAVPPVTAPAPAETIPAPAPAPAAQTETGFATRGILLLVLGIIGIGLLALMLRASDDKPVSVAGSAKPVTPFDPAKRPAPGPQAVPEPPKGEKNRATGSRG